MHRIDGPGATPQNTFTEGDPQQAIPATVVTDDFLNAVQEEIVDVILTAGLALSKPDNTQLRQAVLAMIAASIPDTSNFVAKTGAQSMAGPLTVTGTVTAAPDSLIKNQGAGLPDRGGRLLLEKPVNGTLASNIAVEVGADGVPNRARIGETGGTNRGVFFDLSKAGAGVTSDANFIVAESLGTNGWRKFSDGTIEQWGVAALPAGGFGAVNFNLAHTTSVHSVVLTRFHTAQPGTAQGNPTVLNPIGLTSFSAFSGDTEVINYFWNSRGV